MFLGLGRDFKQGLYFVVTERYFCKALPWNTTGLILVPAPAGSVCDVGIGAMLDLHALLYAIHWLHYLVVGDTMGAFPGTSFPILVPRLRFRLLSTSVGTK